MSIHETRPQFRVIGTTDEVAACGYCGREELKGTVILGELDSDGNVEGYVYYGAGCAATAGKRTVKEIQEEAKAADKAKKAAEQAARDDADQRWSAARDAWISSNYGVDALQDPRKYGFSSPFALVMAYRKATGA